MSDLDKRFKGNYEKCLQCGESHWVNEHGQCLGCCEEMVDDNYVRCPHCGLKEEAWEFVTNDDCFDVDCGECGKGYVVKVHRTVSYRSPERILNGK